MKKAKKKKAEPKSAPHARRGKFQNRSTIAYSLSPIPDFASNTEMALFAAKIEKAFLSFLDRESQKKHSGVLYGGIIWQKEENGAILLSSAFCPFERRLFSPQARIVVNKDGKIDSIQKIKK